MFHPDELAQMQKDPLPAFDDYLQSVTSLDDIKTLYDKFHSKEMGALPEGPARNNVTKAQELVKQRYSQLVKDDTLDLNPVSAITHGMGFATANDVQQGVGTPDGGSPGFGLRSALTTPLNVSKSAIGRGVDKGFDVMGGLGLAALSASEGWRGKPLTAVKLQELGIDRDKLQETKRHNDLTYILARRKQFQQDTKDAMEYTKGELASIRTYKDAAEKGDAGAKQALKESYAQTEKLYPGVGGAIWKRMYAQPDATAGMLDALAQGHYDTTFGKATSLKDIGKPLLDIMGNDKLMALNELRYIHDKGKRDEATGQTIVKDKSYTRTYNPQEIEDLRKRAGMKSGAEVSSEQSDATTKAEQAGQAGVDALLKTLNLQADLAEKRATTGLKVSEKALKDMEIIQGGPIGQKKYHSDAYNQVFSAAARSAGLEGMFQITPTGAIKVDMKSFGTHKAAIGELIQHLRVLAKTRVNTLPKEAIEDLLATADEYQSNLDEATVREKIGKK